MQQSPCVSGPLCIYVSHPTKRWPRYRGTANHCYTLTSVLITFNITGEYFLNHMIIVNLIIFLKYNLLLNTDN